MFSEILHIAAEMLSEYDHLPLSAGKVSQRQLISAGSFITRSLLSLISLWIIFSCLVILLEMIYALTLPVLAGTVVILVVAIFTLITIWKNPLLASRVLIPQSLLLIVVSIIVFASLFDVAFPSSEAALVT